MWFAGEAKTGRRPAAPPARDAKQTNTQKALNVCFLQRFLFRARRADASSRRAVVVAPRRSSVSRSVHSTPMTGSWIFSILANSHSLLHSGQFERVRSHLEMQSRWNTCPQLPHAMDNPSSEAFVGLAWYSMDGSCREFRQIAHVSVQMDHDHTATAFHCFGKRGEEVSGSSWARRVARKKARGISV